MKLDRFKFARLVAWVAKRVKDELTQEDIGELDFLTEMPDTVTQFVSVELVNDLLISFAEADKKGALVPAIKAYRVLTNAGLREAKETIEAVLARTGLNKQ